jgi:hypothetical protein
MQLDHSEDTHHGARQVGQARIGGSASEGINDTGMRLLVVTVVDGQAAMDMAGDRPRTGEDPLDRLAQRRRHRRRQLRGEAFRLSGHRLSASAVDHLSQQDGHLLRQIALGAGEHGLRAVVAPVP